VTVANNHSNNTENFWRAAR